MVYMSNNLKNTIDEVNKNNFKFKKKFGQNFLIDNNILDKISNSADIDKEDIVIEIGPGMGALTQRLCKLCKKLFIIEIDKSLIPILEEKFSEYDNITIVNADCLKVDFRQLLVNCTYKEVKVVANLPYYITTPVIMKLLEEYSDIISSITIMIQKEVADRIMAKAGTSDYGAISLATQFYTDIKHITNVSPQCFIPAPKVTSSVINLQTKKTEYSEEFIKKLFLFIRSAFLQRRKTLVNAIGNSGLNFSDKAKLEKTLLELGFDSNIRGEKLSLNDYIKIVEKL